MIVEVQGGSKIENHNNSLDTLNEKNMKTSFEF